MKGLLRINRNRKGLLHINVKTNILFILYFLIFHAINCVSSRLIVQKREKENGEQLHIIVNLMGVCIYYIYLKKVV